MNTQLAFYLRLIRKEVWSNRRLVIAVYFITSMAFLAAAWMSPRVFTSTSVVLVDSKSILSPLMQGTAVTTEVEDKARRARQIILSKKSIDQVLELDVWKKTLGDDISEFTLEAYNKIIKANTSVQNVGNNLIEISYSDSDPQKAFETADLFTKVFVDGSLEAKQEESRSAFEFIDNQVAIYQQQLQAAENAIKDFRSRNVESTPGAKENASERLVELNTELEAAELEKSAEESSILTRQKQLRGEGNETNREIEKETTLSTRISELENRRDELLLNYMETYPDVVQIKQQIETLKAQLAEVVRKREEGRGNAGGKPTGVLAQELRRQILLSESKITTLNSRIEQLKSRIEREKETLEKIIAVEAEMSELTRDYTINQNMYNDLLAQRENARVSMNIDIENQGLSLKVQDQASLPFTPKGIRFAHIILAGLVISFIIPALLVWGLAELDQKVRNQLFFKETFRVPVLASVYKIPSSAENKKEKLKLVAMVITVLLVWSIYAYAIYLRRYG
ncbi:hypothetical protein FLL45_06335 [Aliikangiella marina]|uniref:Chain length-determining protein n=1 Tax=Aliikangiella marina TaxID=1712262 RepID=A0A545TBJ1_9GAMM|nr:XrtA system polysaccharide chain length determinant [Aliikangiella marina]TQV74577.1 hypothetical protein FLL45_06335 [Aliikangiella marina]